MPTDLRHIAISDFDYPLPDERIARHPMSQRDQSRLLALRGDSISEHSFSDLPSLLPQGAMLVFNDTKVIHARLLFRKETGATIEIFCLEPYQMALSESFEQRERCSWTCLVGNNKRWRDGALTRSVGLDLGDTSLTLSATRRQPIGNSWVIDFEWDGGLSFAEVIERAGVIPLPPYMGRDAEADDAVRYQTVYACHEGSVAAPTAGLHFTPQLLDVLRTAGFSTEYLTLHVGAGTFKPVSSETIGGHEMHVEQVVVSADNLRHFVAQVGRPIIAVGTTSVRTLESLYWFGAQLHRQPTTPAMHIDQWEPYSQPDPELTFAEACTEVLTWLDRRGLDTLRGETQLLIAPGYRYRSISGLVTNFHQPKSTLLLLVSALVGDRWRECYRYALDHGFRFLSYGDSCLFLP